MDWQKVGQYLDDEWYRLHQRADMGNDSAEDRRDIRNRAQIFRVLAEAIRAGLTDAR